MTIYPDTEYRFAHDYGEDVVYIKTHLRFKKDSTYYLAFAEGRYQFDVSDNNSVIEAVNMFHKKMYYAKEHASPEDIGVVIDRDQNEKLYHPMLGWRNK